MTESPVDELPVKQTDLADRRRAQPVVPSDTRALLGPAPITYLEDEEAYERILNQMAIAVSPQDFVEWTWVKDIVDLGWDAARARRAKIVRLTLARRTAIENILRADWPWGAFVDIDHANEIPEKADQIYRGDRGELKSFAETLQRMGLTQQSVEDAAFHEALFDMERLQALVDNANARRDAVLREIDRRRESFSKRARPAVEAMDAVVDAEFE